MQGICPKCGDIGTQIVYSNHPKNPEQMYMKYNHKDGRQCYVGKVRNTEEAMSEFERESMDGELMRALEGISTEIREYCKVLKKRSNMRTKAVVDSIQSILEKYGY